MSRNSAASAAQPNRLANGGLIERARPLSFRFDARAYSGFAGDTLASALLAGGVRRVGRSFKYHRSRGVLTAGSEEPNALVQLRHGARQEANTRATVAELFEGLSARSQNCWPSLAFDLGSINSLFAPLLVAGFYYKTFMWPKAWWEKLYEPAIRRAAGLGRASLQADPDRYDKAHLFCDVLIIGAGPAGLAAALAAARGGARVVICDEDFVPGGRLNGDRRAIGTGGGTDWVGEVVAELMGFADVRLLLRTTVFGVYDGSVRTGSTEGTRTFGAVERVADHLPEPLPHQPRQRLWKIMARRVVLAAGAIERPFVFGGNDRPGVMMAAAVRTYVNRFAVVPGKRVALFTTCDDGWQSAFDLAAVGVAIESIVDARTEVAPSLLEASKAIAAPVHLGAHVVGTRGAAGLNRITIRQRDGALRHAAVDTLAICGGWNPNLALTTHLGGRPLWSASLAAFVPGELPAGMSVAGAARGTFSLAGCLREGAAAGAAAARELGFRCESPAWRADDELFAVAPLWVIAGSTGKAFVDFQHDVTAADVEIAAREGFRSVELLKRYTTLGMATDQGKTSGINGQAIMAALTQRSVPALGTTTFRPPYTPVAIGAFAGTHRGKHLEPVRLTAGHAWAKERGATFIESGEWLRAQWFAAPGEQSWLQTVSREVKAVRRGVGVCDVSTLGKIDVQGADAAQFLDRIYTNLFSSLAVGKVRYGLMLREDGFVLDDGTTAHLAPGHYVMSTTTAHAAKVMRHLEHARQVLWPELDVQLASVTEHWAQFAIAGPEARRVLEQLLGDAIELNDAAFPYMACAQFAWRGLEARLFRISFSGERAYELAVPADYGDATIRAIMQCGESLGIVPYGLEALGVLRIEKGHVAGSELNGTTTAADLGFGRMLSARKDFIGRAMAQRPGLTDPARSVLVGIQPLDPAARLRGGAHLLTPGGAPTLENDQGYLTSVAFSPLLESWIGLALLARGAGRMGECIRVHDPLRGRDVDARIVAPVFYDPQGLRLQG